MTNNHTQIGVSVDAITHIENDIFRLRLIPDFNSQFFIPAHTRQVLVKAELLEPQFLSWVNEYHFFNQIDIHMHETTGSIAQGGYYILDKKDTRKHFAYKQKRPLDREEDIFRNKREKSPYDEFELSGEKMLEVEEKILDAISVEEHGDCCTYLYGFYVGQGDMLLLVTAAKNAYLIDVNLYNQNYRQKIDEIKTILRAHNMDTFQLKGLIITHKHADHLRGASRLLSDKAFQFENLIMNFDYHHPTSMVFDFLKSAKCIPVWINLNMPCLLVEGKTKIYFKNPDATTKLAADINDSSIVMQVEHGTNQLYLTGDACSSVLCNAIGCASMKLPKEKVLKVSHHGSRTGTNSSFIKKLLPYEAFISAGYSRKNQHPHKECIDALKANGIDPILSKKIKTTVEYKCDGASIAQRLL